MQTSIYQIDLENELHLNPINFANTNLDPTRRRGVETIAALKLSDSVRLKGNLTYTDARFSGRAIRRQHRSCRLALGRRRRR